MYTHPVDPTATLEIAFRTYMVHGQLMDSLDPDILDFAADILRSTPDQTEAVIQAYYNIRDGYRYDPYAVNLDRDHMKASAFLHRKNGYCIEKANLLGAVARAMGVPARLGFGDVRNHIGTDKLEKQLGTDLMVFHGYTDLYLNGKWVKATPALNKELCNKLGVEPLEFDGKNDSIFQSAAPGGGKFMAYVNDRGTYAEWPVEDFIAALKEHYGHLFSKEEQGDNLTPLAFTNETN